MVMLTFGLALLCFEWWRICEGKGSDFKYSYSLYIASLLLISVLAGLYNLELLYLALLTPLFFIVESSINNTLKKKPRDDKFIKILWLSLGGFYIFYAYIIAIHITFSTTESRYIFLWLLLVVWSNDIGGYVFGRWVGGVKLCPKISPNKTVSGALGGICLAILTTIVYVYIIIHTDFHFVRYFTNNIMMTIICTIIISLFSQIGDLLESWAKRKHKIKDSGAIIPGHGGLLDRLDGLLGVLFSIGCFLLFYDFINGYTLTAFRHEDSFISIFYMLK